MTTIVTATELASDVRDFLRFKRAMGLSYRRAEFVLNGFVRFLAQHEKERGEIALDEAVTCWIARVHGRKAVTVGNEFSVVVRLTALPSLSSTETCVVCVPSTASAERQKGTGIESFN